MPNPVYTHNFELKLNGITYEGEIEYNEDGICSYEYENHPSFTLEQASLINKFFEVTHEIYKRFGYDFEAIEINKKSV